MTNDEARRRAALTRLAVAVRERLPVEKEHRDAFFRVYLDDLGQFPADVFELACRRLETRLEWFPKKPELYEECVSVMKHRIEQRDEAKRKALPDRPVPPEKIQAFMSQIRQVIQKKGMR